MVSLSRSFYPQLDTLGVRQYQVDLAELPADHQAFQDVESVFHVAAKAGMWGKWDDYYRANVIGTQKVLEACLHNGVRKLVFTSSPSVIFDNSSQAYVNEDIAYPQKYESVYAHTKAISEQLVLNTDQTCLLTVSLRPHLIVGPGDNHLLPTIIERARAGRIPQIGTGLNKVDLSYVADAAKAHILAEKALKPGSIISGKAYFISQDEPVTLWPWLNNLFSELGVPEVKRKLPLRLARFAGGILENIHKAFNIQSDPLITRFIASELALDHYYDISRAKADFGYQPSMDMNAVTKILIEEYK